MNGFEAMIANLADLNLERVNMRNLIAAHSADAPERTYLLARAMIEVGVAKLGSANEDEAANLLRRMRLDLRRGYVFDF